MSVRPEILDETHFHIRSTVLCGVYSVCDTVLCGVLLFTGEACGEAEGGDRTETRTERLRPRPHIPQQISPYISLY